MSHMPMAMSVFLLEMALLPYPTQVPASQGTIKSCAAAMSAVTVVQSMKSSAKDSIKGPSMELPQPQHPLHSLLHIHIHDPF